MLYNVMSYGDMFHDVVVCDVVSCDMMFRNIYCACTNRHRCYTLHLKSTYIYIYTYPHSAYLRQDRIAASSNGNVSANNRGSRIP